MTDDTKGSEIAEETVIQDKRFFCRSLFDVLKKVNHLSDSVEETVCSIDYVLNAPLVTILAPLHESVCFHDQSVRIDEDGWFVAIDEERRPYFYCASIKRPIALSDF